MQMPQMLAYPERSSPRKKSTKWRGALPISAIEKVLTKDNRFADSLLTEELKRIRTDRYRAERLLAWQEQSFVLRQAIKETELREMGVAHVSFLPEIVMKMTEPDVRARRPFGRARRTASQSDTDREEAIGTLPSFGMGNRQHNGRRTQPTTVHKGHFLEDGNSKEVFTRLHGIDLPLYGPQPQSKRERREHEYVEYLQRQQSKVKVTLDPRFRKLEQVLIRTQPNYIDGLPNIQNEVKERNENVRLAGRNLPERLMTKSAKTVHNVQQHLSRKPESVFAKSVWIDVS